MQKRPVSDAQRKLISERTKAALAHVKASGKLLGAHNPRIAAHAKIAIAHSIATNQKEADLFADHLKPIIMHMRQCGMSINAIADELNHQGNKTARGGKWHATTVANLMRRWND